MTHPDQSEQQLRRALGTMNDLQPPTDELFAQRAVVRGRARTHRRRSAFVGAAAALAVVAGGGGTWLLQNGFPSTSLPTPASQAEAGAARGEDGVERDASGAGVSPEAPGVMSDPNGMPPARDAGGWFIGPMTPERAAFEELVPQLTTTWAGTFSGAYATDPANTSIVVAVTRPDPTLEQLVRSAMPVPDDVEFVEAEHSYADKTALADQIRADTEALRADGITVATVAQDYRADRVVVAAHGSDVAQRLASRYGADWVTVTVLAEAPATTLPDGSTVPTLQR